MLPTKIAMNKRESIEKKLIESWRDYDQSVIINNKKAGNELRHDIRYLMACLLNTYLDDDESVDWRGTWADRLIDETFDCDSSGIKVANGLMVCSDRDARKMRITPFNAKFSCPTESIRPVSYQLCLAAEGPWEQGELPSVLPATKDKAIRQQLLEDWSKPDSHWPTIYRSPN
jgi:hypothetical protein